jgi:site-specific recombinase XerD
MSAKEICSGLAKRSQMLALKLSDIDGASKARVRSGKGVKDRMLALSDKVLLMLRDYYKGYRQKRSPQNV